MTKHRVGNHYEDSQRSSGGSGFGEMALSAAVLAGIVDDLTVAGVADNGVVAAGSVILAGLALRTSHMGNESVGRRIFKSALAVGVTGMMVDDMTGIGVIDNPVAAVATVTLLAMNFNDWRNNR